MSRTIWTVAAGLVIAMGCGTTAPGEAAGAKAPVTTTKEAPVTPAWEVKDEAFGKILLPTSTLTKLADGLKWAEGPVWWSKKGCLIYSDVGGDTQYLWTPEKGPQVFRKPSDQANGSTIDLEGRLLACHHATRCVDRTDAAGQCEVLATTYGGSKLNSPNDVVVRSDGTVWFTDPPYGIKADQKEQKVNGVYRLDPGKTEPVLVIDSMDYPNGLCFSPDEKHLYVADSANRGPRAILRFPVSENGTVGKGETFAKVTAGVPDGIRCDADGRLYSSSKLGVEVFDTTGKLLGIIRTPKTTANLTFGGKDGRMLFLTSTDAVWAIDLAVAGAFPKAPEKK